jgi:pimeloyl-ACP methyl ester carboxylesterase
MLPGDPFPPGLRLIAPDRPGYGGSDPKPERTVLDWADDVAQLADALGIRQFAVVGVSGGGPGALACARKMPERLTFVGAVACPAPTDAPSVFVGMSGTNRFFMKLAWRMPWLSNLNTRFIGAVVRRNPARYLKTMQYKLHAVDKVVLARPEIQEMLTTDFAEALRHGSQGMVDDLGANHGRPWGFSLSEIQTNIHIWQCELDSSIPLAMGRYLDRTVPNSELRFIPNAGHLWILEHLNDVLTVAFGEVTKK